MAQQKFYGKGCPVQCPLYQGKVDWHAGLCPNAEQVQKKIMQFKGNMGDMAEARAQADALRKTVEFFKSRSAKKPN